jgi:hypothetical protein
MDFNMRDDTDFLLAEILTITELANAEAHIARTAEKTLNLFILPPYPPKMTVRVEKSYPEPYKIREEKINKRIFQSNTFHINFPIIFP